MLFQPQSLGRVEQAKNTDRAVDAEAQRRGAGALAFELKQVVGQCYRRGEIVKEIANRTAHRRRHINIAFGDRLYDVVVEFYIHAEHEAIGALKRVIIRRLGAGSGTS